MTAVEILNNEYAAIFKFLDENKQPSLSSDLNKYFKKVLILSAASYFEHEIQLLLVRFVSDSTNGNPKLVSFLKRKAIGMQYHTYFTWGEKNKPDEPGKNANAFFSMFGDDFRTECEGEVKKDAGLNSAIKSFIEIGHLRNILVHSNFAAMNLDTKTTEEIYKLYESATPFLTYLERKLLPPRENPANFSSLEVSKK